MTLGGIEKGTQLLKVKTVFLPAILSKMSLHAFLDSCCMEENLGSIMAFLPPYGVLKRLQSHFYDSTQFLPSYPTPPDCSLFEG